MIGAPNLECLPEGVEHFGQCAAVGRLDIAGWYASGVLVHPRVVLTVAHAGPRGGKPLPRAVALRVGDLSDLSGAEVIEGRFAGHDAWSGSGAYDIAAMILERNASVEPASLATAAEIAGAIEVTLVGFGADCERWMGLSVRRSITVPIRFFGGGPEALPECFASTRFSPALEFLAGAEDCGACFGDSGGPAYIEAGGRRKLAGIVSRPAARQKPFCKGLTILTRVDGLRDWIQSLIPEGLTSFSSTANPAS